MKNKREYHRDAFNRAAIKALMRNQRLNIDVKIAGNVK